MHTQTAHHIATLIADPAAPPATRIEPLAWRPTALALPDADITVLCWTEPAAEWHAGWYDGEQWLDAATGGPMAGTVTHWAEPEGPNAKLNGSQRRDQL